MSIGPSPKLYCLIAGCFLTFLGFLWLQALPSGQELYANVAKALDYFEAMRMQGGWPWWTASFNMGHSLSDSVTTFWTYFLIYLGYLIGGESFALTWTKLIGLVLTFVGGLGVFIYVREMISFYFNQKSHPKSVDLNHEMAVSSAWSEWAALAAALFYVVSPQMALRLGGSEHIVIAFSWAFPPWIFLSLHRLANQANMRDSLLLALSCAALTLTYVRTAAVFLPLILFYALWLWMSQRGENRMRLILYLFAAIGIYIFLAVAPLLPWLRESQWMAFFQFDPLDAWQNNFSFKTALSWIDRSGFAMTGMPESFKTNQGGFYLGIVPLASFILWMYQNRKRSDSTIISSIVHLFAGLTLFSFWLACGPKSILQGHFEFLSQAQYAMDWTVPFAWLGLIASCFLIYGLLPKKDYRPLLAFILIAIYLFLPAFKILQLIPLYKNLRAPWAFWEVGGTFCWAIASGISLAALLRHQVHTYKIRVLCFIFLIAIGLLDWSAYGKVFKQKGLSHEFWKDLREITEFLKRDPHSGRVNVVSGRYFYLALPQNTGRGLYAEAFHSHFALKQTRAMSLSNNHSPELLRLHLALMGVSHILLDKEDTSDMEESFWREIFPVAFENKHFALFLNEAALTPFFFGQNWFKVSNDLSIWPRELLWLLKYNYILVAEPKMEYPNQTGQITSSGELQVERGKEHQSPMPLQVYNQKITREKGGEINLPALPENGGWVVIPESYHPDWKAYDEARHSVQVERAFGGIMALFAQQGMTSLHLKFEPPNWYNGCMNLSVASWIICSFCWLGLAITNRKKERKAKLQVVSNFEELNQRQSIQKAAVILPTYNESENIKQQIDFILNADARLDLLIVDDHSPDGTADLVKSHSAYASRVHLLSRKGKLGYASACRDGMKEALSGSKEYDAFLTMDADGSHSTSDLPRLLEALERGADVAIGSRYKDGVRVKDWPFMRLLLSRFGGMYARNILGFPITDPTSGFKAVRREAVKAFLVETWHSKGYIYHVEMITCLLRKKFKIVEIPITFEQRQKGRSKLSFAIVFEASWRVWALLFRDIKTTK